MQARWLIEEHKVDIYNKNSMNLSHGMPVLDAFPAWLEHEAGEAAPFAVTESEIAICFGQRKKFLEPSPINFSLGSKPITYKNSELFQCAVLC